MATPERIGAKTSSQHPRPHHVRNPSAGSTRGAFYANPPMPEKYAKQKRKQRTRRSRALEKENNHNQIDMIGMVNLALEQEAASSLLSDNSTGRPPIASSSINPYSYSQQSYEHLHRSQPQTYGSIGRDIVAPPQAAGIPNSQIRESSPATSSRASSADLNDLELRQPRRLSMIRDMSIEMEYSINDPDASMLSPDKTSIRDSGRSALLGQQYLRETHQVIYNEVGHNHGFPQVVESNKSEDYRQKEIDAFSMLVHSSPAVGSTPSQGENPSEPPNDEAQKVKELQPSVKTDAFKPFKKVSCFKRLRQLLDPTPWLTDDVSFAEDDKELNNALFPEDFGHRSIRGFVRQFLYNPAYPEFNSLQLFVWSILIGIFMGFYTAFWKILIEACVDFVWDDIPTFLKRIGFFTELSGLFPMTHYMWMCPAFFGGVLSYIFAALPMKIPGQNEWIQNLHSKGVQSADTFWQLFILSTLGMSSGLSLGPELPLILTAGMAGSYLGILTGQSVLQARVLNLVGASSAVGGFFGFPMAGALFVLEVPHRLGLQYFEALNPAIFGSIVACLTNRLIVQNDVTGYYEYPFLTSTLPSSIFWHAIIFGLFGTGIGIGYAKIVLKLKKWVHDIFHYHKDETKQAVKIDETAAGTVASALDDEEVGVSIHSSAMETKPLVEKQLDQQQLVKPTNGLSWVTSIFHFSIKAEPKRAAVSGVIAGTLVGVIGMFVPHVMFWGEAQLQTLIDKGRTPLPIFGNDDEPNADLIAWGQCLVDRSDAASREEGFPIACSAIIAIAKILTTGLSVGTGIIGGHFWGPLFVGCIASHFFTDLANLISNSAFGHPAAIATYPCVAVLCTMGACHVVTFRAHTAIMLILTLTISAFDPTGSTDDGNNGGDYSAVFPLLVVSVFVALHVSKDRVVFYNTQRSRGDIMALPEVLCEPGKEGAPMVLNHGNDGSNASHGNESDLSSPEGDSKLDDISALPLQDVEDETLIVEQEVSLEEIELEFESKLKEINNQPESSTVEVPLNDYKTTLNDRPSSAPKTPMVDEKDFANGMSSARLDQLLAVPLEKPTKKKNRNSHRRIMSASAAIGKTSGVETTSYSRRRLPSQFRSPGHSRQNSNSSAASRSDTQRFIRLNSYGELKDFQPSLIEQAQERASSLHRRLPSLSKARNRIRSIDSMEK